MTLRGRINQQVTDWRTQMATARKASAPIKPDINDGIDLAVILIALWLACFVAGIVYGRL